MRGPSNKHESIDLFARGRYGNKIATYADVGEALLGTTQSFAIRYKGPPGVQGPALFGVPRRDLFLKFEELCDSGWERERLYVNEEIDRNRIVFQGELMLNWEDGWLLRGSLGGGTHMREAMRNSQTWKGWPARELLRSRMDPSSWEDLNLVIDEWPDAVIELAVLDTPFGDLAYTGRNSVIWEVRGGY